MTPPVDWARFQTLATGEDALRDLVAFYVPYLDERLGALRSAVEAGAVGDVEQIAHQFAGSNGTAGATAIVPSLLSLEQMAHDGHLETAAAAVVEAETAFLLIRTFLDAQLPRRDANA